MKKKLDLELEKKKVVALVDSLTRLEERVDELSEKINKLEHTAGDMENEYDRLLVKYGNKVREIVEKTTQEQIDDIGLGILKKLVEGGVVTFKKIQRAERGYMEKPHGSTD